MPFVVFQKPFEIPFVFANCILAIQKALNANGNQTPKGNRTPKGNQTPQGNPTSTEKPAPKRKPDFQGNQTAPLFFFKHTLMEIAHVNRNRPR